MDSYLRSSSRRLAESSTRYGQRGLHRDINLMQKKLKIMSGSEILAVPFLKANVEIFSCRASSVAVLRYTL